jgi:tetratricopeptide (TPR) repeat protein
MRRRSRRPADAPQSPARERLISAHGDISGIASTGDYATNVQATVLPAEVFRPASQVAAPPGLMNLPVRPDLFVGRNEVLADLRAALAAGSGVVVVTVVGLGGVGKSTLAAHHAATCSADHALVWWITADTPATIEAGLAALAVAVHPTLSRALPLEALREWALQWLACHDGWLLVLDNVNDPADIAPLTGRVATGRFLVTSRLAAGWHAITSFVVRLDVLSAENAVELLTRIAPGAADGAGELCAELGWLPLAIEQAGAYLAETAISPRAYLALLAEYPAAMFGSAAAAGDAGRTIVRIWRVTLDRLADDPLAGEILRVLAWYAPDPIPRALLYALAEAPDLHRAIGRLAAYSMCTVGDDMTITVHRLVQAVARTPDTTDPHRAPARIDEARAQASTLLDSAIPLGWADPAVWPAWRILVSHIDALTGHAPANTDTATMARLLNMTGLFLGNQGASARAIRFLRRALTDRRRVLGEDHPSTLTSRNNLACAYQDAGDLGRAIPLYEQTLADRRRVLGEDHPSTLTSRNNLAGAYQDAGDLGRAIPLYEQTLTDCVRVLGEDHPDTLGSQNNLAYAYRAAGDLGRAIPLYEQTLADRRRVLGEDHPDTLSSRNNLAYAYQAAGDLGRAIPLYEQTLTDRRRVLGEDHPDTLSSRNNLASAYQAAGDLGRAIPLYEQTLTDRRRVLGEDHPDTLTSRNNLAYAYRAAGDLGRAIPLYEQTLTDCIRVLGEDHHTSALVRDNLAAARRQHT